MYCKCTYCVYIGLSVGAIEGVVTRIKEAAVNTGLVMKGSKTKCVKITRIITNLLLDLIMDGQIFEEVQNSKYLSALKIKKKINNCLYKNQ